jgi:2-oxo-4-hydroxy-4-carboxy-5-ureidoimidazoline decarboxylase
MSTSLQELNDADQEQFVAAIGHIFEGSPHFSARAWEQRPFDGVDALYDALASAMWRALATEQMALIRAHPDLAGKAAIAGDLTTDSTREQASAGLDRLTPDEFARFTRLNAAYQTRFGFPFIICVREHTKSGILAQFEQRLGHSPEQEQETALGEIAKIARLRLLDAVR